VVLLLLPCLAGRPRGCLRIRILGKALEGQRPHPLGDNELQRGYPGALLWPEVQGHRQDRDQLVPRVLVVLNVRLELGHDGSVVPLDLSFRLWMVGRGVQVDYSQKPADPLEECGCQLGPVVRQAGVRGPEGRHPGVAERLRHGFCILMREGRHAGQLAEAVHHHE